MECPNCGSNKSFVIDVRQRRFCSGYFPHRRRECRDCGYRWNTIEVHEKYFDIEMLKKICNKME